MLSFILAQIVNLKEWELSKMLLKRASGAGVTLLEIVISFFILCVAALSASGLISYGHRATKADFRQGEALQILVDRMNAMSALPFSKFKDLLSSSTSVVTIDTKFEDIEFGDEIVIGSNKYSVIAKVNYQAVTFDHLMQLKFPNKDYVPDDPKTWLFEQKSPSKESFDSLAGDREYAVVKILVHVKPIDGDHASERSSAAMTFVCNTED